MLVVGVVILAVAAFGILSGGDDDDGDTAEPVTTEATGGDDDAGDDGDDPATDDAMSAPDCDPETGRIMVPTLLAPNCVPLWDETADNGGATHTGVTADEITLVIYDGPDTDETQIVREAGGTDTITPEEVTSNRERVVEAYQALYETYGRTVVPIVMETAAESDDEVGARADAIRAADELGAFAVIGGPAGTTAFASELASRGVLCFCTASLPQERYEEWAPHVWPGLMSSTQAYVHRADFIVDQLAGKPAEFAGDEALQTQERKFGLVWYETADGAYADGVRFFKEQLAEDGIELELDMAYIYGTGATLDEDAQTIIVRMKDAGVTSVIFAGDPFMPTSLTNQATAQDYWPEWIITGSTGTDSSALARRYDQEQWANAFGISLLLPTLDPEMLQQEGNLVSWFHGEELSSYPSIYDVGRLFTGIHLAGPELTPETFRDGMFSFKPVWGHPTEYGVSYGQDIWDFDDYTGADDIKVIWYDPETADPTVETDPPLGVYRYVDGGKRYLPGEMGDIGEFFNEEGTVIWFTERPESDIPPRYPPRTSREG
ncbi:MAG: ABC transporter substrate-binding protein [Acidimicrobiia bacterium]|nr:ABC transporter substrate-binding protein [Acidimicrobiia bacterium]